jgi:hypothetical protein
MEREDNQGCIEYKRFIKFHNDRRYNSLLSQLKYRLLEGNGVCYYIIGVEDNGEIINITNEDYEESIKNLKLMCSQNKCKILSITKIYKNNLYYYKVHIVDNIPEIEYRILNISNDSNQLDIVGIDYNNIVLISSENSIYDIKKNSKYLVYIINTNLQNIIKNILLFKPDFINLSIEVFNKYINLFEMLQIKSYNYENLYENLNEIIFTNNLNNSNNSKGVLTICSVLFNGNLLNNTKIYGCINNKNITNITKDSLYIYSNDKKSKLNLIDIQHISQSISDINKNKLISISTTTKISNDSHICFNECECNIVFTNELNHICIEKYDETKEYFGYYKNNVLKIRIKNDKILFNKKILLDERYLIIDLIDKYYLINTN